MSRIGSLFLLLSATAAVAQPPTRLDQIGAVARSQSDFYGAIAGRETVRVEWALSAPTVELGNSVKLTLTVRHAVNPRELMRPKLSQRPDFTALFSLLESVPEPPPAEDAKAVAFVYSLRPRAVGTIQLPTLKYLFFHPRAPKGREMQTRFLDPLTLIVTEPVTKLAPPIPLTGPESFFEPPSGSSSASSRVPLAYWLALALGAPFLLVAWVVAWRRLFPDAARLAKVRRNRAVRRVLDRLRAAHRKPDPAGETGAAFRQYLSARFGLSVVADTPAEVGDGLRALHFPPERVADAEKLLRRCDADRFAPKPSGSAVARNAARLIEYWEGVSP